MGKKAVIHIQIPFSVSRPPCVSEGNVQASSEIKHRYMEALRRECSAALALLEEYSVAAIYVGGRSPSSVRPDDIFSLLWFLRSNLNMERKFEISMEVAPQTVGTPSLGGMKSGGVNRICLRIPSMNSGELKDLGFSNGLTGILNALEFIGQFNFRNVSIDTMYGLPNQDAAHLERSLRSIIALSPGHIKIEKCPVLPSNSNDSERSAAESSLERADDATFYSQACNYLESAGYKKYTNHCFAKPGFESLYLNERMAGCDVFGFGVGAVSLMRGVICENITDVHRYIECSGSFDKIVAHSARLTDEQLVSYRESCRSQM